MVTPLLPIENLAERHLGLTSSIAANYLEAARVCLDRHHQSPQTFLLKDDETEQKTEVIWHSTDERTKEAWGNKDDATRDGAYAFAIAASELSYGLFAVRRAETHTGADYYIAPINQSVEDLEECFRLEVSGTDLDIYEVQRRLVLKKQQTQKGKSNVPALAIVIGFRVRLILMQFIEEKL